MSGQMSESVRVGVIGTSGWTDWIFLPGFASHPAAEIVAICGRDRQRGEALARKFDIPRVYTDYRQLIADGDLDAVVVATPDDLHYRMTMEALDARLHVLCEKPLALNVEDARQMWQKAESAGVKHLVLFTWRWQPHFRYLKQLVDEGYIGRCYQAQFRFMAGFARQPRYTWRVDGQRANGVVSDLGAHMIDFARWYVGEIAAVSAHLSSFIAHPSADDQPLVRNNDAALVTLQYENGAQGIIQVSVLAHQELALEVILHGEAGTLEARHVFSGQDAGITLRGRRQDEARLSDLIIPAALVPAPHADSLLAPYLSQPAGPRLFIDSIINDRLTSPNFYDGYRVQQVIDAALKSYQTGSRQYIE